MGLGGGGGGGWKQELRGTNEHGKNMLLNPVRVMKSA